MKKNMSTKRKHVIKAITWNLLAMTTTYIVLSMLPPLFDLQEKKRSWLFGCS